MQLIPSVVILATRDPKRVKMAAAALGSVIVVQTLCYTVLWDLKWAPARAGVGGGRRLTSRGQVLPVESRGYWGVAADCGRDARGRVQRRRAQLCCPG